MPPSHTLTLNIDSSISSGLAALVLDFLLLNFINFHLQLICSSAIMYLIYDKRCAISPKKSFFSSLAGGPVGPARLARFFSILLAFVTACLIVLGFSINGRTKDRYERKTYKSLVKIGTRPADIVFEMEFERRHSGDGFHKTTNFISKRLAATSDSFTCQANSYNQSQIFAFAYENETVDDEMVEQLHKLENAECITSPNFRDPKISRKYSLPAQAPPLLCNVEDVAVSFPNSSSKTGTAEFRETNCGLNLAELQCYREDGKIACAGMSEALDCDGTFVFLVPNIDSPATNEIVQVDGGLSGEDRRKLGMNVAFLSRVGFSGGVANLANIAISEVSFNETLERKMEKPQQVSEIDLTIAIPLLAVVIGVAILVATVSLFMWVSMVYRKRRNGYNTFTSVCEILELANRNTGPKGRFRLNKQGDVFIGVSRGVPEITVVGGDEKELCSNSLWTEEEIGSTTVKLT